MNHQVLRYGLLALTFSLASSPVAAATWQICELHLRVSQVLKQPFPQLQAEVLSASPASSTVECPEQGATLRFTPETADYQSTLPRRQWPKAGQSLRIKYRYLDGICKGDGNSHACRIEHYSVVGR